MAWNPEPEIAALRDYAKKFDRPMVIALSIHQDGNLRIETFGKTKALCKVAGGIGESIIEAINNGHVVPPATEPPGEPVSSVKWIPAPNGLTGRP